MTAWPASPWIAGLLDVGKNADAERTALLDDTRLGVAHR